MGEKEGINWDSILFRRRVKKELKTFSLNGLSNGKLRAVSENSSHANGRTFGFKKVSDDSDHHYI